MVTCCSRQGTPVLIVRRSCVCLCYQNDVVAVVVVDFDIVAAGSVPVKNVVTVVVADDAVAAGSVPVDVHVVAARVADDVVAHVVADDVVEQHRPIHQQLFDFHDL